MSDKRDRSAEIEAMVADADEVARRQEDRHREAVIDVLTDVEMERLGPANHAVTAQLYRLAERVRAARGEDYGSDDEDILPGWWIDPDDTGAIVVYITVNDRNFLFITYTDGPDDSLVAWALWKGKSWWAVVNDDGTFGPWHDEPPPPWLASAN